LRKKSIPYKIYGGISFYGRKEIKDLLSYLRMIINPNDEEALKRVINYPARGIGATTIDKLTIAANHYKKSIFEVLKHLDKINLKLNSGTKTKLQNFLNMILRLQIDAQKLNAFEITELVVKQTQLVKDLEKEGTPEAISKVENVQELLNGVKDFITDKIETGEDASLPVFLEEVALATDLDADKKDDKPKVSLMSIHQSKGLEYPYVYIVGLEENLFPSAMSMNTRSELEEERRLFYVALTRAEKVAYLTYTKTRYRWGKLIDCEPSRFLEEIDEQYLEYITPKKLAPSVNRFLNEDIFGDAPKKIRFQKPIQRKKLERKQENKVVFTPPKNLKKVSHTQPKTNLFDDKIVVGNIIEHNRFGRGEVLNLEGTGANKKAEIQFGTVGKKKLLLQFAKLKVIG
jgi:DNA helicase-2/ATP-dependent DNA helicase PcrA